jgi:hypothetical protein
VIVILKFKKDAMLGFDMFLLQFLLGVLQFLLQNPL